MNPAGVGDENGELLDQQLLRDPEISVKEVLEESGVTVKSFIRLAMGETQVQEARKENSEAAWTPFELVNFWVPGSELKSREISPSRRLFCNMRSRVWDLIWEVMILYVMYGLCDMWAVCRYSRIHKSIAVCAVPHVYDSEGLRAICTCSELKLFDFQELWDKYYGIWFEWWEDRKKCLG